MNPEFPTAQTLLLWANGALLSGLLWMAKVLYTRLRACEDELKDKQKSIEALRAQVGQLTGNLTAYQMCPSIICPFKRPVPHSPAHD